jgi:hypothetical protein
VRPFLEEVRVPCRASRPGGNVSRVQSGGRQMSTGGRWPSLPLLQEDRRRAVGRRDPGARPRWRRVWRSSRRERRIASRTTSRGARYVLVGRPQVYGWSWSAASRSCHGELVGSRFMAGASAAPAPPAPSATARAAGGRSSAGRQPSDRSPCVDRIGCRSCASWSYALTDSIHLNTRAPHHADGGTCAWRHGRLCPPAAGQACRRSVVRSPGCWQAVVGSTTERSGCAAIHRWSPRG